MSVIGSLTATPNRIEIVYRTLLSTAGKGMKTADLKKALCPIANTRTTESDEGEGTTIADEVVREATTLGVLVQEGDTCRVADDLGSGKTALLDWLEERLVDPDKASTFGQEKFPFALAWMLEQDPYTPLDLDDNLKSRINEEFGTDYNAFELTNKARSQNFAYWCQYLGYAWRLSTGRAQLVVPDPTTALDRILRRVLLPGKKRSIADVVSAAASICPVLEGGSARKQLAELGAKGIPDPKNLSLSTSLALFTLRDRDLIALEDVADGSAFLLVTSHSNERVSHITLRKAS